jgi:hypothetical protein
VTTSPPRVRGRSSSPPAPTAWGVLERFEGSLVGPAIRPVPYTNPDGSEGTDLYLDPEVFRDTFAADVDPATAAVMAAIPPALQRFMAERANATIVEVAASHVSFVSQPEAATQLFLQAVEATSRSR